MGIAHFLPIIQKRERAAETRSLKSVIIEEENGQSQLRMGIAYFLLQL